MDIARSQKHVRDSSPDTPTAKPPYKRTKISTNDEVIMTGDDGGDAPAAPARCLLNEEPDAEGFYHCIRVRECVMQPAHSSSRLAAAEAHPLPVEPTVLASSPREVLDQSKLNLVGIESNQGSSNIQGSSISGQPETSSLIINPIAGVARDDEKLTSPNCCDFGGNNCFMDDILARHDQDQDQDGFFGEETNTEDWIRGPLSEGSNYSSDNDCHLDEPVRGRTLRDVLPVSTRTLRSGKKQALFESLPGSPRSVISSAKTVPEAPDLPDVSQEVLPSEAIPPVATASAISAPAISAPAIPAPAIPAPESIETSSQGCLSTDLPPHHSTSVDGTWANVE